MWPVVIPRNLIIKEMRMKPVLNALTLVMVGVGLSGCGYLFGEDGYFRDRGSDYQTAVVEPRMTVPDELQSKPIGDLLPVPGEIRAGGSGKFQLPRPQGINVDTTASDFSLQQNGSERWLLAQHAPASVWPQVRQFLTEYQVPVARESSALGEIETDWLSFDTDASNPLVRRLQPALGASGRRAEQQRIPDRTADVLPDTSGRGLQDTEVRGGGSQQRFRLRVEPGVQSGTSEIKVLHMQRSEGSTHGDWPASSNNSNLERALLAELEAYLNQGGALDSVVLSTVGDAPATRRSSLDQDGAGNPVLNINADFNRAWAAVGQALAAADIQVDDLNRSAGVYYVNPQQSAEADKPGFIGRLFRRGSPEPQSQRTEVRLTPVGNRVQVTVEDSINTSTDSSEARALLSRIHENLN